MRQGIPISNSNSHNTDRCNSKLSAAAAATHTLTHIQPLVALVCVNLERNVNKQTPNRPKNKTRQDKSKTSKVALLAVIVKAPKTKTNDCRIERAVPRIFVFFQVDVILKAVKKM